jgi:hypothetical protein
MTLIVPHRKTKQEAIAQIDRNARDLFMGIAGASVQIAELKKEWNGPTMSFSLVGRLGFISVPLTGTIEVDDVNVTVRCDLPPMVRNFIGDDKVAAGIETQLRRLL